MTEFNYDDYYYSPECPRRDCDGKCLYITDIEGDDMNIYEEFQCEICGEVLHEFKTAISDDES
jgi:hypothetical protein